MHNITMLGTGLIGMFYTMTLHGYRSRDRVKTVFSLSEERAKAFSWAQCGKETEAVYRSIAHAPGSRV